MASSSNRYIRRGAVVDPPAKKKKSPNAKVFMDSIDFPYLVDKARRAKKLTDQLYDWSIHMQEQADGHHKNNLGISRERVSDILQRLSEEVTDYIYEFYKEQ